MRRDSDRRAAPAMKALAIAAAMLQAGCSVQPQLMLNGGVLTHGVPGGKLRYEQGRACQSAGF